MRGLHLLSPGAEECAGSRQGRRPGRPGCPGGGGGGGGITITPVAFIVIENGKCRMMQINNYTSSADRAIAMIPELVDKVTELLKPEKEEAKAEQSSETEE